MSVELAPWPEVGGAGGGRLSADAGDSDTGSAFGFGFGGRNQIQWTDLDTEKGYRTCIRIQKTDSDTENGIEHRTDFDSDRIRIYYEKTIRMKE